VYARILVYVRKLEAEAGAARGRIKALEHALRSQEEAAAQLRDILAAKESREKQRLQRNAEVYTRLKSAHAAGKGAHFHAQSLRIAVHASCVHPAYPRTRSLHATSPRFMRLTFARCTHVAFDRSIIAGLKLADAPNTPNRHMLLQPMSPDSTSSIPLHSSTSPTATRTVSDSAAHHSRMLLQARCQAADSWAAASPARPASCGSWKLWESTKRNERQWRCRSHRSKPRWGAGVRQSV
jgi:hypothetical protein